MQNKKYSPWTDDLTEKVADIKNNLYNFFVKVNELGVKPYATDSDELNSALTEHNESLEENQTKEYIHPTHQKNVKKRSIDKNTTPKENPINSFKLSDKDKNFVEKEMLALPSIDSDIEEFNTYYNGVLLMLSHINSRTRKKNTDFLNNIYMDTIILAKCFAGTKLFVNRALFLIEDEKGRLGFPSRNGIEVANIKHFDYLEYIINNMPKIARVLDISSNILNQYQQHYQELFKNHFNQEKMNKYNQATYKLRDAPIQILSSLKSLTNTRSQDLDLFLDQFVFYDNKSESKKVELFGNIFDDKESAKSCLENMNKNLLSKKFPNFDFYQNIDSLDNNIRYLIKNYKIMNNMIFDNKKVNVDTEIIKHSFFNDDMIAERKNFTVPSPLEKVQCVNPKTLPTRETTSITRNTNTSTALTPTPSTGNTTNSTALMPTPNTGNTTTPSTWNTTSTLNGAQIGGITVAGLLLGTLFVAGFKYFRDKYFSNNQRTIEDELRNIVVETNEHGTGVSAVGGSSYDPLLDSDRRDKNNSHTQGSSIFGKKETRML